MEVKECHVIFIQKLEYIHYNLPTGRQVLYGSSLLAVRRYETRRRLTVLEFVKAKFLVCILLKRVYTK